MPVSTNPSGQAPAQGPGLEDPHDERCPPIYRPEPASVYNNLTHPVTGIKAATMPRTDANTVQHTITSGTIYWIAFGGLRGQVISAATMLTGDAAKTGGTHGWYAVADKTMTVIGITADQTDAATVWGATGTFYPLSFTQPFILGYTGAYYFGYMIAETAGTMPTFTGCPNLQAGASDGTGITSPLILAGSGATGRTTPPTLGTTYDAPSALANALPYVYFT